MSNPILGLGLAGAFLLAAGTIGVDQFVFKPKARELADDLAVASAGVDGSPDTSANLAAALKDYRGREHILLMEHMQNARTFGIADDFGMTFWRIENPENKAIVDLNTSRGKRIFDVTKEFLSAKVINTSAVIDNRDPARGPVFVHDGLEQSQLDVAMDAIKEEFGAADNMPNELIVVVYDKGAVGLFVDEGGVELANSPYADFISKSEWNPKMAEEGLISPGLIEKGLGLLGR